MQKNFFLGLRIIQELKQSKHVRREIIGSYEAVYILYIQMNRASEPPFYVI